jgi:hypothetical protein
MNTLLGTLLVIAAFVALLLWATRNMMDEGTRCPTCGRDVDRGVHHPKCSYWRDR